MRIFGISAAIGMTAIGFWPSVVWAQAVASPPQTRLGGPSTFLPTLPDASPLSNLPAMSEGDRTNLSLPATAYLMGPGDQLEIKVYDQAEMTGAHIIAPDGRITLPMIGTVQAAGKTTDGLTRALTQRLLNLYRNPLVSVNITQFRPMRIHVGGAVRRPGPLQIRNTAYDTNQNGNGSDNGENPNLPTLSAAIVAAGGVTRDGDISQVALKRNGAVQRINLWQGLTSENAPRDLLLRDGDAIFISKRPPNSLLDPRLIATSTLAPTTVRVRVVGEVKSPGEVNVTPNSTISSAIAIAGGPTDKARMEEVRLLRLGENDQIVEQKMNLQQLQDNQQILDGDVVVVPKSRRSNFLDVAGQVIPPLGILFNLFRRN
ncbi:polysaccharide export protein [filamentous cyanobacterium LEGE 11480]|uniref:Polysaccharide export protein n=1 Tax=Romeriopsis navalis LEGE 11480 TaxID=2777977 RepID=A0A928VP75_9CYAN|nr:polysaccharide biosynthesis/export family protein [Romeriopsis navalis]MBE9031935.1 polysaccharide export protein [Romeriopsis navalis LEGE 11480]